MKRLYLTVLFFLLVTAGLAQAQTHKTCADVDLGGRICVEVTQCGLLSGDNRYFLLKNDITSDMTCIFMHGNNNVLDLNDYTLTFGNADVPDIPNFNFEIAKQDEPTKPANWDLSNAYNARIEGKETSKFIDNALRLDKTGAIPQEAISEFVTLPAFERTYEGYAIVQAPTGDKMTLSVERRDGSTACSREIAPNDAATIAYCTFKAPSTGGDYRLRIKHEKSASRTESFARIDFTGIKPTKDIGVFFPLTYTNEWTCIDYPDYGCNAEQKYLFKASSNCIVMNGDIVQGRGNGPHAKGIRVYSELEISDVTIHIKGLEGFNIDSKGSSIRLHDSHIINEGRWVADRMDFNNMPVVIGGAKSKIYRNVFDGGQGCIVIDNKFLPDADAVNHEIYENTFRPNTRTTNHYAIVLYFVKNSLIHSNNFGGIGPSIFLAYANHNKIFGNTFELTSMPCNPEYSDISTSAVKLNDYGGGGAGYNEIYDNLIRAFGDNDLFRTEYPLCLSYLAGFFDCSGDYGNVFRNNNIDIKTKGVQAGNRGIFPVGILVGVKNDKGALFKDNHIKSDLYNVYIGIETVSMGPAENNLFISNIFEKGENAYANYRSMRLGYDAYYSKNTTFIDQKSIGEAKIDNYIVGGTGAKEFNVGWILQANVKDVNSNAVQGASVVIYDKYNNIAFSGETDVSGMARGYIIEYSKNGISMPLETTDYSPHRIVISKAGYTTYTNQNMNVNQNMNLDFILYIDSGQTCPDTICASGEVCPQDCSQETHCTDSTDNDGDSKIDCLDSDCSSSPSCQHSYWVLFRSESFDSAMILTDGQPFGTGNWLTAEVKNSGSITVQDGKARLQTPGYSGSALIRVTNSMNQDYKIRAKIGNAKYNCLDYSIAEYLSSDFTYNCVPGVMNDWWCKHPENGFYWLTVTDQKCEAGCGETWWHSHRKLTIDSDDHLEGAGCDSTHTPGLGCTHVERPLYLIYFSPGDKALYAWANNKWNAKDDWSSAYQYLSTAYYYVEIEKSSSLVTWRLYDANNNPLQASTPISVNLINGMGINDATKEEYLYIGEPHTSSYKGEAYIDEIQLYLKSTPGCKDLDSDGCMGYDPVNCPSGTDNDENKARLDPSDTDCNGCIIMEELNSYINRWYANSSDVNEVALRKAIDYYKAGTGC